MIQGQQVVERATTNSFSKMGDAGDKGFKGAKRMVGQAYKTHQNKKRQEGFPSGEEGAGQKTASTATPGIVSSGTRSKHRNAWGENTPQKQVTGNNQGQQAAGKGGKNAVAALAAGAAPRSASRNACIVHLDDYKSGKGEEASKSSNSSQSA
jgi:hypothetical protein